MAKNTYIIGEKGFFCGTEKIGTGIETRMVSKWSNVLKDAKQLYNKTAKKMIESDTNDINGVIWHPYKEEILPHRYDVILVSNNRYGFIDGPEYQTWEAEKIYDPNKNSDVDFLKNNGEEAKTYYTKDEAERIANEKNKELLKQIQERIMTMIGEKTKEFNL